MKGNFNLFVYCIVSISAFNYSPLAFGSAPFNGFFGGVSVGESQTYGRLLINSSAHNFDSGPDEFTESFSVNNKTTKNSPFFGFTLGYSRVCSGNVYLGGELGANFTRKKISIPINEISSSNVDFLGGFKFDYLLKSNVTTKLRSFEFSLDFTPGVLLTEYYLLYGRIGVADNRIKLENSTQFNYSDTLAPGHTNSASLLLSKNINRLGLRLGTGLAHEIYPHLVLNMNYIYSYYGKIKMSSSTTIPALSPSAPGADAVPDGLKSTNTVRLHNQVFMMGLNYYFDNSCEYKTHYRKYSPCAYSGFFGGVSAGLYQMQSKLKSNTSYNYISPFTTLNQLNLSRSYKIKRQQNSADVGLLIGYSQSINDQFYLGGELGGHYHTKSNVKSDIATNFNVATVPPVVFTNHSVETQLKADLRKFELTADITPGITFCNQFLLYGRVGLAINRVKFESITNSILFGSIAGVESTHTTVASKSFHKTLPGLRLGLGIGQYICDNVVLNANYVYTWYRKGSLVSTADTNTTRAVGGGGVIPNGLISNDSLRLNSQAITIGLNYYFGN